jgi:hypothetical protein
MPGLVGLGDFSIVSRSTVRLSPMIGSKRSKASDRKQGFPAEPLGCHPKKLRGIALVNSFVPREALAVHDQTQLLLRPHE